MKIVMLGHSGVGKTTYMASMYGSLDKGINGFSLRAASDADHRRLIDRAARIAGGGYPDPTDQRGEYDFFLRYQGQNVLPFRWADYRGGALLETSANAEKAALIRDRKEADGILGFCDSDAMARGAAKRTQVGVMTNLLGNALQSLDRKIPLALVFSKSDLVARLDDQLLGAFRGLISAIRASQWVQGTMVRVACGRRPMNVDQPVLFALRHGIVMQAERLQAEFAKARVRAAMDKSKGWTIFGMASDAISLARGEATYHDKAAAARQEAERQRNELIKLVPPAEALARYLGALPVF